MKKFLAASITALLPAVLLLLGIQASRAGSATWNLNPTSSDWNTAANWTPATVPNGPTDIATFASSSRTNLLISAGVEVNSIVFDPGADAFTIKNAPGQLLTISGAGITNNSGVVQNFVNQTHPGQSAELHFTDGATAGDSMLYSNLAGSGSTYGADIEFLDNSMAGSGTFLNTGVAGGYSTTISFHGLASAGEATFTNVTNASGEISFWDTSTADHATITNEPGLYSTISFYQNSTAGNATMINQGGGMDTYSTIYFYDTSTAGNSVITVDGSLFYDFGNAWLLFNANSSAGNANFVANGGQIPDALGGQIYLLDNTTAENGTFIANGGMVGGAFGGSVVFQGYGTEPTAATATLIANGGEGGGGSIVFNGTSVGAQARVELYGSGFLDVRGHAASPELTIGSLEGDGLVLLGGVNLSVGSNNLSSGFSGLIEDAGAIGALTKIGTASLTLIGANTYTGGTIVNGGGLVVNNTTGSGTGTGAVQVNSGILGGNGTISGPVTVGTGSGTGAFLTPGIGASKATVLTIQSALTFKADATYSCRLNTKKTKADQLTANGVTIESGAQFALKVTGDEQLRTGKTATVISNTSASPISGTFVNLPDAAIFTIGPNTFQVSYEGGDGNDLTLTVLP